MADFNIALKAILLKYVGFDKLEECFHAVMFQLDICMRTELAEKIKKITTDKMILMLRQEGYLVTKKEEDAV